MSRGKYAARAANRLVQTDNELLIEKSAEVERLKVALRESEARLAEERTQRGALVIARADELSEEVIAAVERKLVDQGDEHRRANEWIAIWLTDFLQGLAEKHQDKEFYPRELPEVLTRLVGSERAGWFATRVLETYDPKFAARVHRRAGAKTLKSGVAESKRPDWAKGSGHAAYLEPIQ